ncbi:MAG TPA: ABC transporter substrate-binding protein [Casimicrobiaceae bacterium]|nr:ABC transporter substrate-binding protein [Casimicrobiaceae bacterium]
MNLRRTLIITTITAALTTLLPAAATAQDNAPFKIGTVLSVTGPGAFLGDHMKRGMQLAIDEINAKGGINGRKVEWVFYDAETQASKAVTATRRLIDDDKVDIIVGGGNASGLALAMVPLVEKAQVPFISTEGSMQIVNPVAERKWTFKSTLDDDKVLERAADSFAKRGITSVALLYDSSGFGQSAKEQMEKVAPKRGLKVTYETFNPGDTDLTAQLTRIKASDAKAIICWTITPAGVVFVKQAKQLGLGDRVIMHSYGFVDDRYMKQAEGAAEGIDLMSQKFPVGTDLPATDPLKQRIADITARFEKKFNTKPNQFVAQTYDAIYMAADALAKGGKDKEKVRTALEGLTDFKGVGGNFSFSPTSHSGLTKDDAVVINWKNGGWRLAPY